MATDTQLYGILGVRSRKEVKSAGLVPRIGAAAMRVSRHVTPVNALVTVGFHLPASHQYLPPQKV